MMRKSPFAIALVCLTASFAGAAPAQVSTKWTKWQKGSPVQLISHNKSRTHFINGALLMNVSDSPVTQVQLGWAIKGLRDGRFQTLAAFEGDPVSVALPGSATATIGTQEASSLRELGKVVAAHPDVESFVVEIGVVRTNGQAPFAFDLAREGRFPREANPRANALLVEVLNEDLIQAFNEASEARALQYLLALSPKTSETIRKVSLTSQLPPAMFFQSYFSCDSSSDYVYCTNNVSSCTDTLCSNPDACPKQSCRLNSQDPPQGDPDN